jgi:hypothetical protein
MEFADRSWTRVGVDVDLMFLTEHHVSGMACLELTIIHLKRQSFDGGCLCEDIGLITTGSALSMSSRALAEAVVWSSCSKSAMVIRIGGRVRRLPSSRKIKNPGPQEQREHGRRDGQ